MSRRNKCKNCEKPVTRSLLFDYPNLIRSKGFFFFFLIIETFQIDEEASSVAISAEFRLYPVARHIIHL